MSDRIKLAEAMGWKSTGTPDGDILWAMPDSTGNYPDGYCFETCEIPDPFTDANDDYAVLEWMRDTQQMKVVWNAFTSELRDNIELAGTASYVIGDYARAALKVLEQSDE